MTNEVARINYDRTRSQVLPYAGERKHKQRIVGVVTPRRRGINLRAVKKALPLTGMCCRTKSWILSKKGRVVKRIEMKIRKHDDWKTVGGGRWRGGGVRNAAASEQ